MVKRIDPNISSKLEPLSKQDASVTSRTLSSGRSRSKGHMVNDDIIVSLSDAYENRRARQVTEWERRQRATVL